MKIHSGAVDSAAITVHLQAFHIDCIRYSGVVAGHSVGVW